MSNIELDTDFLLLRERFNTAISQLADNVMCLEGYSDPVLIEGGEYPGIWLECGPHEGLIYHALNSTVALNNHRIFFDTQRDDGCISCYMLDDVIAFTQIQMVVPIARSACELGLLMEDDAFMNRAYDACSRWDRWLRLHRDTRGTGLCEAFCEYDTGHDKSPRWRDLPKFCFAKDASRVDQSHAVLPYLAPDLSATVYGGRIALAKMARLLGKASEADRWEELAAEIRQAIFDYCFDDEAMCFFDRDGQGNLLKVRGDVLTRVLQEHVVDADLADELFERHILNPNRFWTPYPLPSIAVDDPVYDDTVNNNSWGGPSQALTALRAPLWFEHYGRYGELNDLMKRWVSVLIENTRFGQQIHPQTGEMGSPDSYSPAMLVLIDFTMRLYGIHEDSEHLTWAAELPEGAEHLSVVLKTRKGEWKWQQSDVNAVATLNGKELFQIVGVCKVLTDKNGRIKSLIGVKSDEQVVVTAAGAKQVVRLRRNEIVDLDSSDISVSI